MGTENRTPEIRFDKFTDNWKQRQLCDIAEIIDGDRGINYPNGDDFKEYGDTMFLSAANVTKDGFLFGTCQYITEEKSLSMGSGKLQLNDVVLTSRGSLGHVAWYHDRIHTRVPHARINSGMLLLRANNSTYPGFIEQCLKSPIGQQQIIAISFGSAQPQLTKKDVGNYTVVIPNDIDEQVAISNFFRSLDDTIALKKQQYEKTINIKKAMLEKMFPKNGADAPEIRFEGYSKAWTKYSFFDTVAKTIDFRGRTPRKLGMDWSESGYIALSALNVKNGYIDFSAEPNFGSEELYQRWMTGNELRKGQVLFTTEAPMGNVAQVPDNRKYILSQRTIAFNFKEDIWLSA